MKSNVSFIWTGQLSRRERFFLPLDAASAATALLFFRFRLPGVEMRRPGELRGPPLRRLEPHGGAGRRLHRPRAPRVWRGLEAPRKPWGGGTKYSRVPSWLEGAGAELKTHIF